MNRGALCARAFAPKETACRARCATGRFVSLRCKFLQRATEASSPLINLRAPLHELDRLRLHALLERLRIGDALLGRIVAHILRDLHRAEVRAAHRTEMRDLRRILRQRFVVEFARLVRIEAEVELVLPAELEARLRERVVPHLRARMTLR